MARETLALLKRTVSPSDFRKMAWENAHRVYRIKTEIGGRWLMRDLGRGAF